MSSLHKDLTTDDIHVPYLRTFADEAARVADAGPYVTADLYKKALQIDTLAEYVLSSLGPPITWSVTAGLHQLIEFSHAIFSGANPAGAGIRNSRPVILFDDTTDENVVFYGIISLCGLAGAVVGRRLRLRFGGKAHSPGSPTAGGS